MKLRRMRITTCVVFACVFGGATVGQPLSFFEPQQIDLGGEVFDLVVADFTGGGRDDVCVAREAEGGAQVIELFEQTVQGEFDLVWSWPIAPGLEPASLALIDFDRVGGPDLVVSVAGPGFNLVDGEGVFVFPNVAGAFGRDEATLTNEIIEQTGDESHFAAPHRVWEFGVGPISVRDVNRDGIDDIVPTTGGSEVVAFVLRESGETERITLGPSGLSSFHALQFGDIDGDHDFDIVLSRSNLNTGSGTLLINNGIPYEAVALPFEPILGKGLLRDLTGDGKVDLFRRDGFGMALMAGDGSANFAESGYSIPWRMGLSEIRDIDGDGHLDVLGRRRLAFNFAPNEEMMILYGNGASGFDGPFFWWPSDRSGAGVVTIDLVGDGRADVALGASRSISFLRNRGQRQFTAAQILRARTAYYGFVAAGDITGDGRSELVLTVDPTAVEQDRVEIFGAASGPLRRVAGFSYETPRVGVTVPRVPRLIDSDGDRDLDLAFSSWGFNGPENESFLQLDILANVDGEFDTTSVRNLFQACPGTTAGLAIHDANGDGKPDLLMVDPGFHLESQCGEDDTHARLVVVTGDGAGFLSEPTVTPFGPHPFNLVVIFSFFGDVNSDGLEDIVLERFIHDPFSSVGKPVLLPGAVNGLGAAQSYDAVKMRWPRTFVDFNADGLIDVVGRPEESVIDGVTSTGNQIAVQIGHEDGTLGEPQLLMILPNVTQSARIQSLDLNGDGTVEIALTAQGPMGNQLFLLPTGRIPVDEGDALILDSPFVGLELGAGDLDGDGDLELILGSSGVVVFESAIADAIAGDINSSGVVDGADLALLIQAWGSNESAADFNRDGVVDGLDLARLLANWGP